MTDPIAAGTAPMGIELKQGEEKYWCACGRSKSQPWCDGAHKGTGLSPLAWKAPKDGTCWMCTCKKTKAAPQCDGSHKKS